MQRRWSWLGVLVVAASAAGGCAGQPLAPPAASDTTVSEVASTSSIPAASTSTSPPTSAVPAVTQLPALDPVVTRIATTAPVAFLTIDDGWARDPQVVALVRDQHLPVTVFLLTAAGREDPAYFRALAAAGATIEDHTLTHRRLAGLSLATQEHEICGSADDDAATYGVRPTLFRPPYGAFDTVTRQAARACGMAAVVTWNATVNDANVVASGGGLQPGAILLLHFRPSLYTDLQAALAAVAAAHLQLARLESFVAKPGAVAAGR